MIFRQVGKWTFLIFASLFLYALILEAQIHFWGSVLAPHEHAFLGRTGYYADPLQFMWFLNWWNDALSHHINPLYSDFLWYPTKVSTLWVTSIPFLSIMTAPLQKAYGIVFTYNLLTILSPILAATSALILCYFLTGSWLPSFIGGFFFGFSSYEFDCLLGGDFNLSFVPILPLVVLVTIISPGAKLRKELLLSSLLGVLLVAEFLVSTEILAILVFFSTLSMVFFYFTYHNKQLLIHLSKRIGAGLLVASLILAPLIPSLLHGKVYGGGKAMNTFDVGNDLLSFVTPPPSQLISYRVPLPWYDNASGGGYLGIPVVLIILIYARSQWKFPQGKFLISLMGLTLLLSLGATFHLFGLCLSPLPWTLAEHLPLIGYALAMRFTLYFWLVFAVVVSLWLLEEPIKSREYLKKIGLLLLAILFLWPKPWHQNRIVNHPIFATGEVCTILPPGKTLLYFPWEGGKIDYQQLAAHLCFKAAEGYYGAVPHPFNKWPLNYLFVRHKFKEMSPTIFHQYLANFNVGLVVISKTLGNRTDLEVLLEKSGFERSSDPPKDPTVEIYSPGKNFVYVKLTKKELEKIYTYREKSLREAVIASNREKLKQVVYKLGFSSDKKFQDIYSWLLTHHILK